MSSVTRIAGAAHVLERSAGRRAIIESHQPVETLATSMFDRQPPVDGAVLIRGPRRATRPRPLLASAERWYRAREVDPDSPDDVASLALLRWWSRSPTGRLDPDGFSDFQQAFATWWAQTPECRLAVLVEEVQGERPGRPEGEAGHRGPTPVAMGWVIPCPVVPRPGGPGHRQSPAVTDGVFVLPGTPAARIRRDLAAAMARLAASRGLYLTPLPSRA